MLHSFRHALQVDLFWGLGQFIRKKRVISCERNMHFLAVPCKSEDTS